VGRYLPNWDTIYYKITDIIKLNVLFPEHMPSNRIFNNGTYAHIAVLQVGINGIGMKNPTQTLPPPSAVRIANIKA
jgi:hypothetical protein